MIALNAFFVSRNDKKEVYWEGGKITMKSHLGRLGYAGWIDWSKCATLLLIGRQVRQMRSTKQQELLVSNTIPQPHK